MKKFLGITLAVLLLLSAPLQAVSTYVDNSVKVMVNGSPVSADVVMHNNSVFVPLRFISNQLDAQVNWDSNTRTVAIQKSSPAKRTAQGEIVINGSETFKKTINSALSLLKTKAPAKYKIVNDSITSITEANLGKALSNIYASNGKCNINLSAVNEFAKRSRLTTQETNIYLASVLVHEAYHANLHQRQIQDTPEGISRLESEVLAETQQRQTIKALGGSTKLLQITSVDYLIDTNYYGNLN